MRTILVLLFLILYFLIGIPIFLIIWIIGKFDMDKRIRFAQWCVRWGFRCILFLSGTKIDVKGLEKIEKDKTYVFVGDHRSYFDIVIAYSLLPCKTGFIAKKEMMKIPFLSWWMYFVNCLFLDRDNIKEGLKTILAAIAKAKEGISIFIFPEGTRSHTDELLPFHDGSFKVAQKSGCPVVPVAFVNTASIYEKHRPWIKAANVVIEFGNPIDLSSLEKENQKHPGAYFSNLIGEMCQKNAL